MAIPRTVLGRPGAGAPYHAAGRAVGWGRSWNQNPSLTTSSHCPEPPRQSLELSVCSLAGLAARGSWFSREVWGMRAAVIQGRGPLLRFHATCYPTVLGGHFPESAQRTSQM